MSKTIINFLLGSEPIDGLWFGDTNTARKPFWWRFHLRQYDESKDKEIEDLKKLYNDLAESHAKHVIEIESLKKENEELRFDANILSMQLSKVKIESSNFAYQCDRAKDDTYKAEAELLKAKELITKCAIFMHDQIIDDAIIEFLNKK